MMWVVSSIIFRPLGRHDYVHCPNVNRDFVFMNDSIICFYMHIETKNTQNSS